MSLLRRALYLQATLKGLLGLSLCLAPGTLLSIFGMAVPPERAWMRVLGINFIVLAMLAVLVARRIEEAWWWAWAFVFGNLATATFAVVKVALSLGEGGGDLYWWGLVVVNLALASITAIGLAKAGQERVPE